MNVGVDEARSALLINQPLRLREIEERCHEIKHNLFLNDDDISKLERETRGQSADKNGLITDLDESLHLNVTE